MTLHNGDSDQEKVTHVRRGVRCIRWYGKFFLLMASVTIWGDLGLSTQSRNVPFSARLKCPLFGLSI